MDPGSDAGTVIAAVPLFPSLVAVIVVVPGATPLTTPVPLTVATDVLSLDHDIARFTSTLPAESAAVTLSCTVVPVGRLATAGATVTDATRSSTTVTVAVSGVAETLP